MPDFLTLNSLNLRGLAQKRRHRNDHRSIPWRRQDVDGDRAERVALAIPQVGNVSVEHRERKGEGNNYHF